MSLRRTVIVGLCLLPLANARAFWVIVPVHQQITQDALSDRSFTYAENGNTAQFSDRAIAAINKMHLIADGRGDAADPREHFDSEKLISGFQLLQNRRKQLLAMLAGPGPNPELAHELLGLMIHQIQDFYAHSTWVPALLPDGGVKLPGIDYFVAQAPIVDFGKATSPNVNTPPPEFRQSDVDIGDVCEADGITLNAPVAKVTTGYYDVATPSGKCAHGSVAAAVAQTIACAGILPSGISHDQPCSSSLRDVYIFFAAKALATRETEAFVQSIVDELRDSKDSVGFCALLGLPDDDTNPVCVTAMPDSVTQTLVVGAVMPPFSPFAEVVGGKRPYKYAVTDGTLPAGIRLDEDTGFVSGTPTGLYGPADVTFSLSDAVGTTAIRTSKVTFTVTDSIIGGTWSGTATQTVCGALCGSSIPGTQFTASMELVPDSPTSFHGKFYLDGALFRDITSGTLTGNSLTMDYTSPNTSWYGYCSGAVNGDQLNTTCTDIIGPGWGENTGKVNGVTEERLIRIGPPP